MSLIGKKSDKNTRAIIISKTVLMRGLGTIFFLLRYNGDNEL
jgi:hypothetical protein